MQYHSSHAIYIIRISCVSFILHNQHDHSYLKHDFKSSLRSENAIRYLIKMYTNVNILHEIYNYAGKGSNVCNI